MWLNEAIEQAILNEGKRAIEEAVDRLLKEEMSKPAFCGLTLNEYQVQAMRTINKSNLPSENEMHAVHGMSSEVGEINDLYQKMYQGHQFDKDHVKKELGDLLWFIAEYCTACDMTLEEVAQANIDKLKARYPDGFDPDKSLHRKEGDI